MSSPSVIAMLTALLGVVLLAPGGAARLAPVQQLDSHDRSSAAEPARRRWRHRSSLTWIVGSVAGVALVGVSMAAIVAAAGWAIVRGRLLLTARAERSARLHALPDAIDAFVLLAHAGLTPRQAVEHLVESAPPAARRGFADVVERLHRGQPLADALGALADFFGPSAVSLVELVAGSSRYGLPMADVLTQLSNETRATRRRLDEAAARSLPVRLSFPLVVCTLPSFVLLAIAPAVMAALSSLSDTAW